MKREGLNEKALDHDKGAYDGHDSAVWANFSQFPDDDNPPKINQ
jgi:hypothetical protein